MLSLTSEYAMRAMVFLAQNSDDVLVPGKTIADGTDIPRKYLSTVLGDLVRAGMLASTPGTKGGFKLTRSPKLIMLHEIMAPFEPPLNNRRECPFGYEECSGENPCAGHNQWLRVRETYSRFLERTSLYDVTFKRRARKRGGSRKRVK